jgi:membrane-bound serine protease (ClpP class)
MRLLRLLYLSCLSVGYLLMVAVGPATAWAGNAEPLPTNSNHSTAPAAAATPVARVLTFDADVNPVTAGYVRRGIQEATRDGDSIVVILLNTPGGDLGSMQQITQDIVNSAVPVMVFVWPHSGWAASAGVFITYSAHVAVMAPGSSIGAAHPVFASSSGSAPAADQTPGTGSSDQEELQKVTNFSVAYIRGFADRRGRNADWAEKAVRESVAVTAQEAVDQHIVDYIAPDLTSALDQADGRVVEMGSGKVTLHTKGATTVDMPMNSIEQFLQLLANSSLAYTLITIGGLALTAEVFNPGLIFPGVIGVIMILVGLVALGMLPVNLTGVGLIVFAFVLFIADLFMTSHGILTAGGIASLVLAGMLLIDTSQTPGVPGVSPWVIAGLSGSIGAVFFFGIFKAVAARRRKPTTGVEGLVGSPGEVRTALAPQGMVFADGALWRAVSVNGPATPGQQVVITGVDGLTLYVRPVEVPAVDGKASEESKTIPLADA